MFHFKLQKFLEITETQERAKQTEVMQKDNELRNWIEFKNNVHQQMQQSLSKDEVMALDVRFVPFSSHKIGADLKKLEAIEHRIEEEKERLNFLRSELSKISMKRKGLESFREKKFKEYKKSERLKEQKRMDEIHQGFVGVVTSRGRVR